MLSGIVHLNKKHVGFSENEIKAITTEVLEMFYSQEMMDEDIRRAQDAVSLWRAGCSIRWGTKIFTNRYPLLFELK
jgi:hypothetical protein